MATSESIAITREKALQSLKTNTHEIALLAGVEPPMMEFLFRDKDLQQAEELKALADFNHRLKAVLVERLQLAVVATEGSDNGRPSGTAKTTSHRPRR